MPNSLNWIRKLNCKNYKDFQPLIMIVKNVMGIIGGKRNMVNRKIRQKKNKFYKNEIIVFNVLMFYMIVLIIPL